MSAIFNDGSVCEVHVKYWSAEVHLKPRDLGLDPTKISKAFSLGHKSLIPDEEMKKFRTNESAARALLEKNSFKYALGTARFVPNLMIDETIEGIEKLVEERRALAEYLVAHYDELKARMVPVYTEAAEIAFENMTPTGTIEFSIEGREADKANFVANYLEQIKKLYPAKEVLADRFTMWLDVWPTSINFDRSAPTALRQQVEQANAQLRNQLAQQAEVQAKRTIDIEEYRARTAARMDKYAEEVVVPTLRKWVKELCEDVAENIKGGQVVTERTYNRIRNFMERVRKMNFVGDTVVEQQLNDFRREFLDVFSSEKVREDSELQQELQTRLVAISQRVGDMSDVSEITGQYVRRVAIKRNGGSNGTAA